MENLEGIVIGGPGHTKEEFVNGDYLNYELKQKIITTVDTSYTGEFGIREVIDKSSDVLDELDVIKEKQIVQKFLKELVNEKGLASYGEKEVRKNLLIGAVDTLLLSEDLLSTRNTIKCVNCGKTKEITLKPGETYADKNCEDCNEKMKITSSKTLIEDFVKNAEEVGSDVEFISTETEEGMQLLKAFGGVAAILRYNIG
jgi:peptide chain release factor subunit 1